MKDTQTTSESDKNQDYANPHLSPLFYDYDAAEDRAFEWGEKRRANNPKLQAIREQARKKREQELIRNQKELEQVLRDRKALEQEPRKQGELEQLLRRQGELEQTIRKQQALEQELARK
jgi:hypothetical protein